MSNSMTRSDSIQEKEDLALEHNSAGIENDLAIVGQEGHAATDAEGNVLVHLDPEVEARIRRKIDFRLIPLLSLLYLLCFLDRTNIGNARLSTFEKDLGLKGNDYNILLTAFYVPVR